MNQESQVQIPHGPASFLFLPLAQLAIDCLLKTRGHSRGRAGKDLHLTILHHWKTTRKTCVGRHRPLRRDTGLACFPKKIKQKGTRILKTAENLKKGILGKSKIWENWQMFCQNESHLVSSPGDLWQLFKFSEQGRRLFLFCCGIFQSVLLGALRYSYKTTPIQAGACLAFCSLNSGFCEVLATSTQGFPPWILSLKPAWRRENPIRNTIRWTTTLCQATGPTLCLCSSFSVYSGD